MKLKRGHEVNRLDEKVNIKSVLDAHKRLANSFFQRRVERREKFQKTNFKLKIFFYYKTLLGLKNEDV